MVCCRSRYAGSPASIGVSHVILRFMDSSGSFIKFYNCNIAEILYVPNGVCIHFYGKRERVCNSLKKKKKKKMETSSFVLFVLIHSGEILFRYYFYQKKK